MGFKILSFLFSWLIFNREKRQEFRQFCEQKSLGKKILKAQENYNKIILRLKTKKKLNVIFLVNDNAKWKTQSLYDLMNISEDFEPIIIISLAEKQRALSKDKKQIILEENIIFFKDKGMPYKLGWDTDKDKAISLEEFLPDIVFYQQPWGIPNNQKPKNVSNYALTCYVPYFVPNFGILSMDCRTFHKFLYRYYVLNSDWANLYKDYMKEFGDNIKVTGHTALDYFYVNKGSNNDKNYVIYAPHWSISHKNNENNTNYSTFTKYGKFMLEYAKAHPQINWMFKPHPKLRSTLENIGEMSEEEIDKYYKEWEKIGVVCYSGDYMSLFNDSKAMITDSASFLIEYFYTGKPLIHLLPDSARTNIPKPTLDIINTYYKVKNIEDLEQYLDNIIIKDNDTLKQERLSLLAESENTYAAQNIINDIRKAIQS